MTLEDRVKFISKELKLKVTDEGTYESKATSDGRKVVMVIKGNIVMCSVFVGKEQKRMVSSKITPITDLPDMVKTYLEELK